MAHMKLKTFKPDEQGVKKALGGLEAEIMELIWRNNKASVREVHAELLGRRQIAYTTVMTVMGRLVDKGILKKKRDGNHYVYQPTISREDFGRSVIEIVLRGIKKEMSAPVLIHFMESLTMDERTLAELERLLREKKEKLNDAK